VSFPLRGHAQYGEVGSWRGVGVLRAELDACRVGWADALLHPRTEVSQSLLKRAAIAHRVRAGGGRARVVVHRAVDEPDGELVREAGAEGLPYRRAEPVRLPGKRVDVHEA